MRGGVHLSDSKMEMISVKIPKGNAQQVAENIEEEVYNIEITLTCLAHYGWKDSDIYSEMDAIRRQKTEAAEQIREQIENQTGEEESPNGLEELFS